MQYDFSSLTALVSARPLYVAVLLAATAISVLALYFLFSRRKSPNSELSVITAAPSPGAVNARADEVITLMVEKQFVRSLVKAHLDSMAQKPRFTFSEFVTFGMPALIALLVVAAFLHSVVTSGKLDPPQTLSSILTAIVGYYFGAARQRT